MSEHRSYYTCRPPARPVSERAPAGSGSPRGREQAKAPRSRQQRVTGRQLDLAAAVLVVRADLQSAEA